MQRRAPVAQFQFQTLRLAKFHLILLQAHPYLPWCVHSGTSSQRQTIFFPKLLCLLLAACRSFEHHSSACLFRSSGKIAIDTRQSLLIFSIRKPVGGKDNLSIFPSPFDNAKEHLTGHYRSYSLPPQGIITTIEQGQYSRAQHTSLELLILLPHPLVLQAQQSLLLACVALSCHDTGPSRPGSSSSSSYCNSLSRTVQLLLYQARTASHQPFYFPNCPIQEDPSETSVLQLLWLL